MDWNRPPLQVHLLSPSPQTEKPQPPSHIESFSQKVPQDPISSQTHKSPQFSFLSLHPVPSGHIPIPIRDQNPTPLTKFRLLLFPPQETSQVLAHISILPEATSAFPGVQKHSTWTSYPTIAPTILLFNLFSNFCISIETSNRKCPFSILCLRNLADKVARLCLCHLFTWNIEAIAWKNIQIEPNITHFLKVTIAQLISWL